MQPKNVILLTKGGKRFPIKAIHFSSKQVTIEESKNIFNTVSIKDVKFDYSAMTEKEINNFKKKFNKYLQT